MALFGFGKKKEETNVPACSCSNGCKIMDAEVVESLADCCGGAVNGICCIKVLGSGGQSCQLRSDFIVVFSHGGDVHIELPCDITFVAHTRILPQVGGELFFLGNSLQNIFQLIFLPKTPVQ